MNPIAQKYGAPRLPGINVIPQEIAEKKKMRAAITTAVLVVLIAVAVVIVGFVLAFIARVAIEADRDSAVEDELAAVAERDGKAQIYYDVLEREQEEFTLAQIGFGEIDYAQLTASIQGTASGETRFEEIHLEGPSALGVVDTTSDGSVFGGSIGTVSFIAHAESLEAANALIASLEAVPGIANVRGVTEAVGSDGADSYWRLEGEGVLTDLLLTGRLIPTDGLTAVDSALAPIIGPTVEPSPTPVPSASEEG
ncbi:hypothetical protein [Demequina zhanjiangensis]|uniref:Uncharacterized protein n=1 Tax=Demequina zhanjiangensis TaxID=3051659 RepID=A0ABT8G349_9MICO|nr:hypothetical protein [Demequina sp. SYSU T00b26]MDN4473349.1 hypothetical protein [Demequina sp. SYSU T00b26]